MSKKIFNIYIYEVNTLNYNRYVNEISRRLVTFSNIQNVFYICDTFVNSNLIKYNNFGNKIKIISVSKIAIMIKNNPPDAFICCGYRIPDLYWTYIFKRAGAITFQVQHGLYTEYLPKSFKGSLLKLRRNFRYLQYLLRLLFFPLEDRMLTVISIFRKDLKLEFSEPRIDEKLMSNKIFIWGKYWEGWYKEHLFYRSDKVRYVVCGNFDETILQNKENILKDDTAACYICQTFVEDGRMEKRTFSSIIEMLYDFVERTQTKLYIRPHPRTNLDLYSKILGHPKVEVTRKFPYTRKYIGHYSGLLSICCRKDSSLVLIDLPGHEIPVFFLNVATSVVPLQEKLEIDAFHKTGEIEKEKDPSYYYKKESDPYLIISKEILFDIHRRQSA